MMRVILTGGTGFVGGKLVAHLLQRGDQVAVLTRHPEAAAEGCGGAEIYAYSPEGVAEALNAGPAQAFIHTACAYGRQGEGVAELLEANLMMPMRLLLVCRGRVGRFINLGTALPASTSAYAMSKRQFSDWLSQIPACEAPCRIDFLMQHVFGPGDHPSKFPTFLAQACLREDSVDLTSGLQQRDFLYVDDVISALVLACGMPLTKACTTLELGSGVAPSLREFAEAIHLQAGGKARLNFGARAPRPNEPECCCADITGLMELGWKIEVPLEEGIRRLVQSERAALMRKEVNP